MSEEQNPPTEEQPAPPPPAVEQPAERQEIADTEKAVDPVARASNIRRRLYDAARGNR